MDLLTLLAFIAALGYNIYLADKMAKTNRAFPGRFYNKYFRDFFENSSKSDFVVYGGRAAQRRSIQKFVDKNQEELSSKVSKDMIDSIAYGFYSNGLEPPYKNTRTIMGFDKAVLESDSSSEVTLKYPDKTTKRMEDLRKASEYYLSRGDNATANYFNKEAIEVGKNAIPEIIMCKPSYGTPMLEKILPELRKYNQINHSSCFTLQDKSTKHRINNVFFNLNIPAYIDKNTGGLDYVLYCHRRTYSDAWRIIKDFIMSGYHVDHKVVPDRIEKNIEAIRKYKEGLK